MASSLPSAALSPQIVNGVVEWYQNDSFTYVIQITLINPITQEQIEIQPDDSLQVTFYSSTGKVVHTFSAKGSELVKNEDGSQGLSLNFTEEISSKFVVCSKDQLAKNSKYSYCIKLFDTTGVHTIGANLEARVKSCH